MVLQTNNEIMRYRERIFLALRREHPELADEHIDNVSVRVNGTYELLNNLRNLERPTRAQLEATRTPQSTREAMERHFRSTLVRGKSLSDLVLSHLAVAAVTAPGSDLSKQAEELVGVLTARNAPPPPDLDLERPLEVPR